jgi:hypothetical protein
MAVAIPSPPSWVTRYAPSRDIMLTAMGRDSGAEGTPARVLVRRAQVTARRVTFGKVKPDIAASWVR